MIPAPYTPLGPPPASVVGGSSSSDGEHDAGQAQATRTTAASSRQDRGAYEFIAPLTPGNVQSLGGTPKSGQKGAAASLSGAERPASRTGASSNSDLATSAGRTGRLSPVEVVKQKTRLKEFCARAQNTASAKRSPYKKLLEAEKRMTAQQVAELGEDTKPAKERVSRALADLGAIAQSVDGAKGGSWMSSSSAP